MPRMARVVAVGYPHHLIQRGNRRQKTFFSESDYQYYFDLLVWAKSRANLDVWAYCFMPNHVHLIVVPYQKDSLSKFFGEAHRRYTRRINKREGWLGHLWQERFRSCPMDEFHLLAGVRYTERNPVCAKLCRSASDWHWSSTAAHLQRQDNALVSVQPMLDRIDNWKEYLGDRDDSVINEAIRLHSRTGRPMGDDDFIAELEAVTNRILKRRKPGPTKKKTDPKES